MDNLRGQFTGQDANTEQDFDPADEETSVEPPPYPIGQDERRMQVRAYNFWASLLGDRNFPSIANLDPKNLPDFGPYSVLLDFSTGLENPAIPFLGAELAEECACSESIKSLSDIPSRSLLSRITDHYLQILANQAPIGFEAEFVNQHGETVLYRGILLPFSSDDETIDFIYGVINWKELADQQTADDLLLEIDKALDIGRNPEVEPLDLGQWADGPLDDDAAQDWPEPAFGLESEPVEIPAGDTTADQPDIGHEPSSDSLSELELTAESTDADMALADWLASAREMALAAKGSEDRSRQALYAAIGRAYDFSLAAAEEPEEFQSLVCDSGLTVQERAPMTPVVKLVFGADYDKTRLTEYASALSHAQRIGLGRGELSGFLLAAPGGLKGVVTQERRLKREEQGKPVEARDAPREALARKLRQLEARPLGDVPAEGSEFTLLVARRMPDGEVVLLGEVADDIALLECAARRLVG